MKKLLLLCLLVSCCVPVWAQTTLTDREDIPSWVHPDNVPWNVEDYYITWGTQHDVGSGPDISGVVGWRQHWRRHFRTVVVDPQKIATLEEEIKTLQDEREIIELDIIELESEIATLEADFQDYMNGEYSEFQDKSAPNLMKSKLEKQHERQDLLVERQEKTEEIEKTITEMEEEIHNTKDEEWHEHINTTYFFEYSWPSN